MSLFRQEALRHASSKALGEVLILHPISHWILTGVFSAVGLAVVTFVVCCGYTKKAEVSGLLLPRVGLVRVVGTQAGVIVNRSVKEGQEVSKGEVLFIISSERRSSADGDTDAKVTTLLQERQDSMRSDMESLRQQAQYSVETAERRRASIESEIPLLRSQITDQQERVDIAKEEYQQFADLERNGIVARVDAQKRMADLIDARVKLADLMRSQKAAEQELSSAGASVKERVDKGRADRAAWKREIGAVQQEIAENSARRQIDIVAPQDARVGAIAAGTGQSIGVGQTLMVLLPKGEELEAVLYVPSRAAGFLTAGQKVNLRYDAYAFQKFGTAHGVVKSISNVAVRAEEIDPLAQPLVSRGTSEPLYCVHVEVERESVRAYGSEIPLRAGGRVDASILLERRRLIEWAFEPLITMAKKL